MQLLIFRIEDIEKNQVSILSIRNTIALESWKILGNKTTYITNKGIIENNSLGLYLNSFNKILLYGGGVIYDTKKKIPLIINFFDEFKIAEFLSYVNRFYHEVLPVVDKLNSLLIPAEKLHQYPLFYQTNSKKIKYFSRISYSNIAKIKLFGTKKDLDKIQKTYSKVFRFCEHTSVLEVFPLERINFQNKILLSQFDRTIEIATKRAFFDNIDLLISTQSSPEKLKNKADIIIGKEYENEILYGAICNISKEMDCKNYKVVGK